MSDSNKITQVTALITAIGALGASFAGWKTNDSSQEQSYEALRNTVEDQQEMIETLEENLDTLTEWIEQREARPRDDDISLRPQRPKFKKNPSFRPLPQYEDLGQKPRERDGVRSQP